MSRVPDSMTWRQKEYERGIARAAANASGRPVALLKNSRSSSGREMSATGVPSSLAARRVSRSNASSGGVSRRAVHLAAANLAGSGGASLTSGMMARNLRAKRTTHEVGTRLDRVFITPLDREDIHLLASRLDDVMDLIDGTARRLHIFRAGDAPLGATLIAEVIARATTQLQVAVEGLEQNKSGAVLGACVRVKRLEEEGDSLYHEWLGRLFDGEPEPLTVIKWKEIYDNLEKTLDYIEDAGNVLESISIKHA